MTYISRVLPTAFLLLCGSTITFADDATATYRIEVEGGKHDRIATPVRAVLPVPKAWTGEVHVSLKDASGNAIPAQLDAPGLLDKLESNDDKTTPFVLTWVLPKLSAGKSLNLEATVSRGPGKETTPFRWSDTEGDHVDLLLNDRPLVRYMYHPYEDDPAKRDLNNKPFHHLFAPTGTHLVTKGSGGAYTHHQGLFYGFTRCTFGETRCNTWYCHDGEHELHLKTLEEIAGPVMARHRTQIAWNDQKANTFCEETRELSAFNVPGGTLVEWSSRLKSLVDEVTLDGDSQHAGFQFRAADEVATTTKGETVYLRPDGRGEPGATRNPNRGQEVPGTEDEATKLVMNLPWKVMSFTVGGNRYSAAYLDSPQNPKPSFYSERDYGRFGSWFGQQTLRKDGPPIELRYRIWLQEGEMTRNDAEALSANFADPPRIIVKPES